MQWKLKPEPNPQITAELAKELGVENTLAKLLVQRGIETYNQAKTYFRPSLTDLHNPFLLKDMDNAVERIEKALVRQTSFTTGWKTQHATTNLADLVAK